MTDRTPNPDPDPTIPLLNPGSGPFQDRDSVSMEGESEAPRLPTFGAGDLLAGRYRIVRFIAQGGMGEVYEAEDLELKERVALKTVRPEAALKQRALSRFRREILLARRVTHPNVCRLHDVAYHSPLGAAGPRLLFLSMELLEGQTLGEALKSEGAMTLRAALPLVRQMAEGLAAAHAAGVVHRDFNPNNVMLVAATGGVRAVVTDFGLAHAVAPDPAEESLTIEGRALGTPAYMAPEQVEGLEATAASDIYALGITVFEMLTGRRPFQATTALATAVKRLREPPPSPREIDPTIDERWEAAILRCLELDPAARYSDPREMAADLGGSAAAPGASLGLPAHRKPGHRLLGTVAVVGIALAGVLLIWMASTQWRVRRVPEASLSASVAPAAVTSRPSIAVLGFRNTTEAVETAWLATAFGEMLGTELSAGGVLRVAPAERVAQARLELARIDLQPLAEDSLHRFRRILGVDYLVVGSYSALGPEAGDQLRVDLILQNAESGETVAAIKETGTVAELFDLVSSAGLRLRGSLGVSGISSAEARQVKASLPSDPEAARFYAEGLERLRLFDTLEARRLLEKAVVAEPSHPLVRAALARAWAALGYERRASAEAEKAAELATGLPREDELLVKGQADEIGGRWPEAVDVYGALWEFFPDSLEYGLRLASAQVRAGRGESALGSVARLRRLPGAAALDPRIDLAEGRAAYSLSDYPRQRAAASAAVVKGVDQGARMLVAEGRILEGTALRKLGRPGDAEAAYEEAREIYGEVGNSSGEGRALDRIAVVRLDQGQLEEAASLFGRSLVLWREIGYRRGAAIALSNLAIVRKRQGDLAGARQAFEAALAEFREVGDRRNESRTLSNLANTLIDLGVVNETLRAYEESLEIRREIGDRDGEAQVLNNLANTLMDLGEIPRARELFDQVLEINRDLGDRTGVADALTSLGELLYSEGRLDESRRRHEEALAVAREAGVRITQSWALFGLGNVELAAGNLTAAERRQEEGLEIRREEGERINVASSLLALAKVSLASGKAARADELIEEAVEALANAGREDLEARASACRARAQAAIGNRAGASEALERAQRSAAGVSRPVVQLAVALAAAEVALLGSPAFEGGEEEIEALERAVGKARQSGLMGLALEGRLALARLEHAMGREEGRQRFEAVVSEAREKGYLLIARSEI